MGRSWVRFSIHKSQITIDVIATVIGVAGGSGSGKPTVVRRIVDSLGPERVVVLEHDR
jgi:uridine kinase